MEPALVPDLLASDANTLRLVTNPAACKLLQLPAELREIIWRYTLLEPRLWERRHRPTCKEYDPVAEEESPPFAIMDKYKVEAYAEERHDEDSEEVDAEAAQRQEGEVWHYRTHTCAKRRGLGLLATNKQIHGEASPIFWNNTTFCFDSARDFWSTMQSEPSRWPKIVSLSFMNFRWEMWFVIREYGEEMFEILSEMKQLREIELEQVYLEHRLQDFITLRNLTTLRILAIGCPRLALGKPWEQMLYTASPLEIQMPQCEGEIHQKQEVGCAMPSVCPHCLPKMQEIQREAASRPREPSGWMWHEMGINTDHQKVFQISEELYTVPVYLRFADRYMDTRIWGLPTSSVVKHKRAYWRKQAEARRTWPGPRQPRPVAFVSEQQEEAKSTNNGRSARSYKCQQQRADSDQQAKIQSRADAKNEVAKEEVAKQEKSSKKEARLKKKGEREMHEEKKAAKRRSHRR